MSKCISFLLLSSPKLYFEDKWDRNLIMNSYGGQINLAPENSAFLCWSRKCDQVYGVFEVNLTRNKSGQDSVSLYNCGSLCTVFGSLYIILKRLCNIHPLGDVTIKVS